MKPDSVRITSESEDAARILGAQRLGVDPEEVTVSPLENAEFDVSLSNAPGQVEVEIRDEKMSAVVTSITPPRGDGTPVTAEDVKRALADAGVAFGIDDEAIETLVAEVAGSGETRKDVRVASGKPPIPGTDATLDVKVGAAAPNENLVGRYVVKKGQVVAVKTPATEGESGVNVLGEDLEAAKGGDCEFAAGENVDVSPDGLTFTATAYGTAEATPKSISVNIPIHVSDDECSARLVVSPLVFDNTKATLEDILDAMKREGVTHGIKEDAIRAALGSDQPPSEVVVAEGIPATDGVDGRVEFEFCLNGEDPNRIHALREQGGLDESGIVKEVVMGGDVLAVKIPPEPAAEGTSVTGAPIAGREPQDIELTAGANVTMDDDGNRFVAREGAIGYANYAGGTICVEEPLDVSEDGMSARLSVHPPGSSGKALNAELVEALLEKGGIKHGIDRGAVESALAGTASSGKPVHGVLVAQGKAPERGQDARFTFHIQPGLRAGALDEKTGRIDYRERGALQSVAAGTVLAEKSPATPGVDGIDVFGKAVSAAPGTDRDLTCQGNVAVSEDGTRYTAEVDGIVSVVGEDKIGVFQQYDIAGDVDYSTGNLNMKGALNIRGWVRAGFTVRATGAVCIGEGIEDAVVEAGADLDVRGGIVGRGGCEIRAGGDVRADFIENARVAAGGDVLVKNDIVRSSVSAEGFIDATAGRGNVVGGSASALRGLAARQLGSRAQAETVVDVGTDEKTRKLMELCEQKLAFPSRGRRKAELALNRLDRQGKSKGLTSNESAMLAKLVKFRRDAALREAKLVQCRKTLAERAAAFKKEPVSVRVTGSVYGGTTVIIMGCRHLVREDIDRGGSFVLDSEGWTVEYVD